MPTPLLADARRWVGRPAEELPTPCLTLDATLLEANLATLQADVAQAGKAVRAHAKSHKSTRLAQRQLAHGAIGICAAKLAEAERLLAAGITGVLLTGPAVSPEAHERLARCLANGADLTLTLDDLDNAQHLSRALARSGASAPFLLDLDVGQGRTGVSPGDALRVAREIAALPGLRLVGVQAYAGHLQHLLSRAEREAANRAALAPAQEVFSALRDEGAQHLSLGGTGSYEFDLQLPQVTEVQAGSYALMDADYLAVEPSHGPHWRFAPALQLLTRVMSRQQRGYVTLDAGLKAIYHDGPAPLVADGRPLVYDWFGDEYGRLSALPGDAASEAALAALRLGSVVPLIVSHCDPTVNLFDFYYVIEEGIVVDLWPIDLRGCGY